jgi:hypothetical protein
MAASYYVDSRRGSDVNPGTLNAPWAKIAKANSNLKAGDTVYIRAGTYVETIRPANSGKSGNYITYEAYDGEGVIIGGAILQGADLHDRSWIKIKGFKFIDTKDGWIEFTPNGSHNYIVDNEFESTGSSMRWVGINMRDRADYNKFIDNSFTSACMPRDLVNLYDSSYNLFEGNYFGYSAHASFAIMSYGKTTAYNIVRYNTFQNPWHHNLAILNRAEHTLVEWNTVLDAGSECSMDSCYENPCGQEIDIPKSRENHAGLKIYSKYGIYRNNVMINNGKSVINSWSSVKSAVQNRIYNNTFYANYIGWGIDSDGSAPLSGNVTKNNIFSQSKQQNMHASNIPDTDNQLTNNNFDGSANVVYKGVFGISKIENSYPSEWSDTKQISPGFVNPGARNLNLRSDSRMIDAGAWLTKITSPGGSGNTFYVADSRYFSNGFGVIPGDKIQIQGQPATVRIKSVNYSTHEIVVDRSVSWQKGNGVSLPYTGAAPDIGAFEYGHSEYVQTELVPPILSIVKTD